MQASLKSDRPTRFARTGWRVYALVIVYASLYPFIGWRLPVSAAFSNFFWPRLWSGMDVIINMLAYLPLGLLLAFNQAAGSRRFLKAFLPGAALSLGMELVQFLLPSRVPSTFDWLSNSMGAAVGVALVLLPPGRQIVGHFLRWRKHFMRAEASADWGMVLLGIWFISQLNPGIPFFEAGNIINQLTADWHIDPYAPLFLIPQAMGVALNVFGFVLFVSVLLKPVHGRFRLILLVMMSGFSLKFATAALMLRAPLMDSWLGPPAIFGLSAGMVAGFLCMGLAYRPRLLLATLLVFAGGLLSKMSGVYDALDETLRLFDWPFDRYGNFASLTQSLHEVWPLLTVIFLGYCFIRHEPNPETKPDAKSETGNMSP